MKFLEQIQNSVTSTMSHPYAKPLLLVLLVLLVIYFVTKRNSVQYGGAEEEVKITSNEAPPMVEGKAMSPTSPETAPPVAVVLFYSNQCGACHVLMPTWDQVANKFQQSPKVMIDKVDCAQDKEAGEQFNIQGYPTILKLRKDGSREEYQGDRSPESIEAFITAL